MNHPEPDIIDALAYGMLEEPLRSATKRHVRGCRPCQDRLRRVRAEAKHLRKTLAKPRRILFPGAAAALVLLAAITSFYRPAPGSLILPDGTEIRSRGVVRLTGERSLLVESGEVDLDVARGTVPFVVKTPTADIEVLGTRFTVSVEERSLSKGRFLVTAVAVAAGTVAVGNQFGWIDLLPGETAVVRASRAPRTSTDPAPATDELEAELARLREREAQLLKEVEEPDSRPLPADSPREEIPEAIRQAGSELGVGEAALKAAVRADRVFRASPYGKHDAELTALVAYGEEGFRAVVALLKAGRGGIWFDQLIEATWAPGREEHLLALARDEAVLARGGWAILRGLGLADTPEVRSYLLGRLETEEDAGLFMSAAEALGRLEESRAAIHFEGKLGRKGWGGVRGYLLNSLAQMGGPDAERVLVEYIRNQYAEAPVSALRTLHRLDPDAARREARHLLSGSRRDFLKSHDIAWLERLAGE